MTRDQRGLAAALLCSSIGLAASAALAADRTPMPEYTGERVYVRDVPDTLRALPRAIKELERGSPQTYYVVAIRTAGPQGATAYADELYRTWSAQAKKSNLKLDPERSVIAVLAIDDRRAAVHAGSILRNRLGLDGETITRQIAQAFAPFARDQKYDEAAAALLASLNNVVAAKDSKTAEVKLGTTLFPAMPATAQAAAKPAPPATTSESQATGTIAASQPVAAARSGSAGDVIWALLASLLAVGLIVAFLVWLARRRARNSVEGKIKVYKKKAVDVMDHLDALKARLKNLTAQDPDFTQPVSGATLAVFEQAQADLTRLWDRWLEVMDVLDKAQALAKKDSALGTEKLKEADKLVSDAKVFEQIEDASKVVATTMDRLNQAHETARATADNVVERQNEITERVEKVDREGLPTVPYRPELDGIAAQAEQAREILTPDPIGAQETLGQALGRAVKLRDRVGQILERYAEGREISGKLTSLGEKVAEHRRQGLRLDEEGGDPDHPSATTFRSLEALRKSIHEGDPETALQQLDAAKAGLQQAEQTLQSVLSARDFCAKDQPDRVRETGRLRDALPQYEAFEAELRRDFAPSSWQAVSGHLAQARNLLETFDRKTDEAAAAATPGTQKYLLGARLLGQVAQEQQAVYQLMAGVADQLNGLKALREECQAAARGLDDREHAIARYAAQNGHAIGGQARATLKSAQDSRRQLEGLLRQPQSDWPRIHQLVVRTLDEYTAAQNQAEADVQVYQQLGGEYERTRNEAGRIWAFLAGHEEDRLAANQHYKSAEDALARVESEMRGTGGEWARLLETVRGAAADLERSEQLAREDIRLARQAESEIEEAARTIRKARAYFSMGVTLGTMGADSAVSEAQRLYQTQNYEQAIRTAAGAIQQVRQAYAVAAQQVFARQMQVEAARRRYVSPPSIGGGMGLGGVIAGAAIGTAASQAMAEPQDDAGPMELPDESTSASGSWGSETAEGGW